MIKEKEKIEQLKDRDQLYLDHHLIGKLIYALLILIVSDKTLGAGNPLCLTNHMFQPKNHSRIRKLLNLFTAKKKVICLRLNRDLGLKSFPICHQI